MVAIRGQTFELAASEAVMEKFERALRKNPLQAHKAALRALRRSMRSGKSAASREIRQVINLKKPPVDRRIDARIISQRALVARVTARDRRIELVEFMSPAQIATAYRRQRAGRSKGVPVKTRKDKGRQVYTGAFLEKGARDRNWHVLQREGRSQYPIYIKYGPNMTSEFEKQLPAFAERQTEALQKNLNHEFDRMLEL